MIHLTDGLDAPYNILKERVELLRSAGKRMSLLHTQISIGCIFSFLISLFTSTFGMFVVDDDDDLDI